MKTEIIKVGKRELRIMGLARKRAAESSAEKTIESLSKKGLIVIEDKWLLTRGLTGGRAGDWNYCFSLTEKGRDVLNSN